MAADQAASSSGVIATGMLRCEWAASGDGEMEHYHDAEWGVPVHADNKLFEMLTLEGAQAGLSWRTVLKKRERYREAFDDFDIAEVARYPDEKVEELVLNTGIIRHRLKITSAIVNARLCLEIQNEMGSLDHYFWGFTDRKTIYRGPNSESPTTSKLSDAVSADLKARGFKFVGPTIIYAFLQAVGIVNDHDHRCFLYNEAGRKTTNTVWAARIPPIACSPPSSKGGRRVPGQSLTSANTLVSWYYTRAGCSTCKKAESWLEKKSFIPDVIEKSGSNKLGREDARLLLSGATRVVACKGRKVATIGLSPTPSEEEVVSILGPTGNLRAPIVKLKSGVVVVGYNESVYETEL